MAFEGLSEKLQGALKKMTGRGKLTEAAVKEGMREVRMALLEADVNFKVAKDFIKTVTEKATDAEILESLSPTQQVIKIVNEELVSLLGGQTTRLTISPNPPTIVMMAGLQGAGKTTNCAKLAALLRKQQQRRPLLVACDVYRPAAIEQLKVVGKQLNIPVFDEGQGDPVEIAKHGIDFARKNGYDLVFLDTAGRLHIDEKLMDELKNIKATVKPTEIILVVDAMTGQDAVTVAQTFDEALGIDGVLMSKMDGDARGGAALSVKAVTGKPIKFIGTGEEARRYRAVPPGPYGKPHPRHGRCADADRKGAGVLRSEAGSRNRQEDDGRQADADRFLRSAAENEKHGLDGGNARHAAGCGRKSPRRCKDRRKADGAYRSHHPVYDPEGER